VLSPNDRQILLGALRPPFGYRLDCAVGTTYTLDLLTLLTAPLAFTFFDWEDADGQPTADPLALLETVRRHADRMHIFCQAGRIHVPKKAQTLLSYLEDSVIEAQAPHEHGAFHPKVWVLRFVAEDEPVRYRLLCLSRNLTFDQSWDTVLVLDGELRDRKTPIKENHGLGDFVAALPGFAVRSPRPEARAAVEKIQREVRRVAFTLPEHFDRYAFWPLGLGAADASPLDEFDGGRLMVVSPFVGEEVLRSVAENVHELIVVSRTDELAQVSPETLAACEAAYVLAPEATPEEGQDDSGLRGLHAKLFVFEDGSWDARLWTGSANATTAAFERNVEFVVELSGKRSKIGIDRILGEEEDAVGLRGLLAPFGGAPTQPDPEKARLERVADQVRRAIANAGLELRVEEGDEKDLYSLALGAPDTPEVDESAAVSCWPIQLGDTHEKAMISEEGLARWTRVSLQRLSSFLAVRVAIEVKRCHHEETFVLSLPLNGAPADRRERLLHALLGDPGRVLRLLWLLLADVDVSVSDLVDEGASVWGKGGWGQSDGGFPLLERMLTALERSPHRLGEVERLIRDLQRTPEGRRLLLPGLMQIWEPIRKVRRELDRGKA